METKTDLYTKIVLTVIAVALVGHLIKDIDLVSTAQASELDLSAMKIENVSDNEGTTFFIYENDELESGFGKDKYPSTRWSYSPPSMSSKDLTKAYIEEEWDFPKYIITSKKGTFWLSK